MAKSELGTKRIDPETGRKFYDLNKDPIVSPYTGKSYPRSYFESGTDAVVEEEEEVEQKELDVEEEGARVGFARGGRRGGQGRRRRASGDRGRGRGRSRRRRDDTFLADEEEEDDDVADIIGVGEDDDESLKSTAPAAPRRCRRPFAEIAGARGLDIDKGAGLEAAFRRNGRQGPFRVISSPETAPAHAGCGAIAQLGERLNGIQEVVGSIPIGSTKSSNELMPVNFFPERREGYLGTRKRSPTRQLSSRFFQVESLPDPRRRLL